tara:strand:+ start:693 stop:815 length:123 start_codon:yes stop_codon:yes gene_type:complete
MKSGILIKNGKLYSPRKRCAALFVGLKPTLASCFIRVHPR